MISRTPGRPSARSAIEVNLQEPEKLDEDLLDLQTNEVISRNIARARTINFDGCSGEGQNTSAHSVTAEDCCRATALLKFKFDDRIGRSGYASQCHHGGGGSSKLQTAQVLEGSA